MFNSLNYRLLSTILFLLFLAWKVSSSTSIHPAGDIPMKRTLLVPDDDAMLWRSAYARNKLAFLLRGDQTLTFYVSWLAAIAFVLVGLKPVVKTVAGLVQAINSRKKHSILLACLLFQPFHLPLASAAVYVFPNGTTVVDYPADVILQSASDATTGQMILDTRNKGDIVLKAGSDRLVQIVGSRLDLLDAALNLTNTHVTIDEIISQSLLINGTLITTTHSDIDIVLAPKGGGKVIVGSGKTLDVRGVTLLLDNDHISGDKIDGGTIDVVTITTLTAGTVKSNTLTTTSGDISLNPAGSTVSLASSKTLDVSQGTLTLAPNQISGDSINGGTIDGVAITALTSGQVTVDNVKLDGNVVQSTSGDLEFMCPAGQVVRVGDTLAVGQLVMRESTLNTTDHNTLLLSPHGFGSVKVAEGKTLDLRGATLLLDDDAIRGDKVDGGTIHNITIVKLVSGQIQIGSLKLGSETISSTGDIKLQPGTGRMVEVTKPLEVQDLKLQGTTIATTTGVPITINNMTCPMATFTRVTAGKLIVEDNEITCTDSTCDVEIAATGTGDVVLKSDVVISAGKTITGSEAIFSSVKTSTISTTSGDLTLSPTGTNVKVASGKTLDLTGGAVVVGTGGVVSAGGVRDSHAWSSNVVRETQIDATASAGGFGQNSRSSVSAAPMQLTDFAIYNLTSQFGPPGSGMRGFRGSACDGRYCYFLPYDWNSAAVLRHDTQQSFQSEGSWLAYAPGSAAYSGGGIAGGFLYLNYPSNGVVRRHDLSKSSQFASLDSWESVNIANIGGSDGGKYGGFVAANEYIYFPQGQKNFLRYDTSKPFGDLASAWKYTNIANLTGEDNVRGYPTGCFDGTRYLYLAPYHNQVAYHYLFLRFDVITGNANGQFGADGWTIFDLQQVHINARGFIGAVAAGRFIYLIPSDKNAVIRYDTTRDFSSVSSYATFIDANVEDMGGAVFDGIRYLYLAPFESTWFIRHDTWNDFTSADSWSKIEIGPLCGSTKHMFHSIATDGRYLYMPSFAWSATNALNMIVRFDTHAPTSLPPSLRHLANSPAFYMSHDSNIGIGTTSPAQKLHVEGSVAGAAFRDGGGWGSFKPSQTRTEIGVAGGGGFGGGIDTGGDMTAEFFEGFNAVNVPPGTMKGYVGCFTDGRYVYYAPAYYHCRVLRYDTHQNFTSPSAWEGYDASATGPGSLVGYYGGAYANGYVYFAPFYKGGGVYHGIVLRYDVRLPFASSTSWSAFDASSISPGNMVGYHGASFTGRYIVFNPSHDASGRHGRVLKYDIKGDFRSASSWSGFDATNVSPGTMKGYQGSVNTGKSVVFCPYHDGSSVHGRALMWDTRQPFASSSSWLGYDAGSTPPGLMLGFVGCVFDSRYVYMSPYTAGGKVLRYDSFLPFNSSHSWTGFDASNTAPAPGAMKGFHGAVFLAHRVFFVPYESSGTRTGRILAYDTRRPFTEMSSWSGFDAKDVTPGNMVGFYGGCSDGRYLYLSGYYDDSAAHGRMLRFDARSTGEFRPSIRHVAGDSELFLAPNRNVGIGTTSPSQKLHVEGSLCVTEKVGIGTINNPTTELEVNGTARVDKLEAQSSLTVGANVTSLGAGEAVHVDGGVGATGGFRDSHAWASQNARRAQLSMGLSAGAGLGTGVASGGPMLSSHFQVFDVSSINAGLKGYAGGTTDGRYSYFAPFHDNTDHHGRVLRLDSTKSFTSSSAWDYFDACAISPGTMTGFHSSLFDGRYVYMTPYNQGVWSGKILRYDTTLPFHSSSSWMGFDTSAAPLGVKCFIGASFDGTFIYFAPHLDARVLRLDTRLPFDSASSYSIYDASGIDPGSMGVFTGSIFDSVYVYFAPNANGKILRYNTARNFTESSSWSGYDSSVKGFYGASFDSRFIYFVPCQYGSPHGTVLRLDTKGAFTSSMSYLSYDAANVGPGGMVGFRGSVYDGKYVYMIPWETGRLLRYNTLEPFLSSSSWSGIDAGSGVYSGFDGATFTGRNLVLIASHKSPHHIGPFHSTFIQYDTRAPQPRPSIQQIASNQDLFISSNSSVGIGTTSPRAKLQVGEPGDGTYALANAWTTFSDARFKSNIRPLANAMAIVRGMRGVRFEWNQKPGLGFVAQELEQVVPEVVVTGSDGYKAVDYGKLSAVLVVAVQEMEKSSNEKINTLEQQHSDMIKTMEQQINALEQQLVQGQKENNAKINKLEQQHNDDKINTLEQQLNSKIKTLEQQLIERLER